VLGNGKTVDINTFFIAYIYILKKNIKTVNDYLILVPMLVPSYWIKTMLVGRVILRRPR